MSISKTILIGRVGNEPEQRHFPSGGSVTNCSLATTEKWKNKDGQKQEKTTWHNLKFNGGLSDVVIQYVHKGDQIYIEGTINTEEWEKDGQKQYKQVIKCREMQMLGSKSDSGKKQSPNATGGAQSAQPNFDDFDEPPF